MIAQIQDGNEDIQQINTDLLANKVNAEDFKEITDTIQSGATLTPEQHNTLVQSNVLTPVAQVDLSMPDINIKEKAVVEPEPVTDVVVMPTKAVIPPKIKKFGIFDTITNYIYKIFFTKKQ
jgi:hypothetical protein